MSKASMQSASQSTSQPGYEGHFEELDGYTVAFEHFSDGGDFSPLFRGLPDDRCQSHHWGVVLEGQITFTYADRVEVVEAGEAYYAGPGHTPSSTPGTRTVEFTPTPELRQTMEIVMANAAALAGQV
jgi:mannose-6-phosphate isomerase-like protein (cupin superfamily)